MTSGPFPSSDSISEHPVELVHSDLHGPLPVATAEGYRYWMTFIDDCTKLQAVMYLRRKSDAFEAFKTFKAYAENQLNAKIKAVQDDKAGEYMSAAFHKFMDQCGIASATAPGIGLSRMEWQSEQTAPFLTMLLSMLNEAKLPASFWALAVTAYVHVWTRLPTAPLPGTTPYTQWFK